MADGRAVQAGREGVGQNLESACRLFPLVGWVLDL